MSTAAAERRPLKEDLRALWRAPRELWLVLLTKLVEYTGVFSLLYVITLWLSKDLGMNDVTAGWWAGLFSTVATVASFFVGFAADSLGFRATLIVAFAVSAVARAAMTFSHGRVLSLVGLMVLGLGVAAGTPAMNAAIRQYTTLKNRSFGFSLYYVSFNIGGALAGLLVDRARAAFADPVTHEQQFKVVHVPWIGEMTMSAYGMVFFVGLGCSITAFVLALLLRKDVDAERDEAREEESATPAAAVAAKKSPWAIAWELMQEKAFWRFLLFASLLSLVRIIFQHYHFTWPKYVLRTMGETFPLGKFQSINPIIIIFGVPIATALTRHRSAFNCILIGSFISVASMFILCLPASYPTILASIFFLAAGEAVWSPRLYEYTASIAPKGREASYMGLSSFPYFLAKMMAGPMGGYLLAAYCPEQGPRHPAMIWLVIGGVSLAGPVLVLLLRGTIEGKNRPPGRSSVGVSSS